MATYTPENPKITCEQPEGKTEIHVSPVDGLSISAEDISWQDCFVIIAALVCFTIICVWLFKTRIASFASRRKRRSKDV